MSRPKGSKNKPDEIVTNTEKPEIEHGLQQNPTTSDIEEEALVSHFEAAQHFRTSESTIKIWIDHGHLEEKNRRIPMRSITMCKFNSRRPV